MYIIRVRVYYALTLSSSASLGSKQTCHCFSSIFFFIWRISPTESTEEALGRFKKLLTCFFNFRISSSRKTLRRIKQSISPTNRLYFFSRHRLAATSFPKASKICFLSRSMLLNDERNVSASLFKLFLQSQPAHIRADI